MANISTKPGFIRPELLSGIMAKLTIGNPTLTEELYKLLDTLPSDKRNAITEMVMKYGEDVDLSTLVNPERQRNEESRFLLHTAAEALEPQPPIDWIVQPLFSPGTVSIVVGNPGSKKTYSMLDLSVCLAKGKSWLGFKTEPTHVLLIDEESGVRRINRRLGDVMRGHSANGSIPLQYIALARFNFRSSGNQVFDDLVTLEEKIKETQARFVVIDALADVMPGADENSVKDVQPIFMGLRAVADNTQSAIVLIHHSNRGGTYRGSSAILGALDLLLMVKSKPDSPNIDFEVQKNRDDKPIDFAAVAHFEEENKFYLSPSQYTPKQDLNKAQTYVLSYLLDHGSSSITDITSNADGCSKKSARQAIYSLALLGFTVRVDGGVAGKKAIYDLTADGREKGKTCE